MRASMPCMIRRMVGPERQSGTVGSSGRAAGLALGSDVGALLSFQVLNYSGPGGWARTPCRRFCCRPPCTGA